jgi:hypothetical protein
MLAAAARLYDCFVLKWNLHGDAFVQPGFLVQTVRTPAVLVHCQRSLSTALSTGVDRVRLIEAYAALDARATIAAISAIRFRVHRFQFGVRIIIPQTPISIRRK